MASNLENLETRRTAIYVELAAMSSTKSGGKPTYNIDGQMVNHTQYRLSLYEEIDRLDRLIGSATGPFEVTSELDG